MPQRASSTCLSSTPAKFVNEYLSAPRWEAFPATAPHSPRITSSSAIRSSVSINLPGSLAMMLANALQRYVLTINYLAFAAAANATR